MIKRMNKRVLTTKNSRYTIAALAATGLVGATIAASGAASGATADSPAKVITDSQVPAVASNARARGTVSSLLARGSALSAAQISSLKSSTAVTGNNGDVARARAITPPAGAEKGAPWFVVPSTDASGRVCLDTGASVACGSSDLLATSGLATARIDRPDTDSPAPRVWAAGGTLTLSGVVPSDVVEVVALRSDGAVSERAEVTGQVYQLKVATDDVSSVDFRDADGKSSGVIPIGS